MKAFAEHPVEGPLAVETGIQVHLRNRIIRIHQQPDRILQPYLIHILIEIHVKCPRKDARQHIRAASLHPP